MQEEYLLLEYEKPEDLVDEVNRLLNLGWQCQGGVSTVQLIHTENQQIQTKVYYHQAMISYTGLNEI